MAEVNWGLGQGNALQQNALQLGAQFGTQLKQQRQDRAFSNALTGIVANPEADAQQMTEWAKNLPGNQVAQLLQLQNQQRQQAVEGRQQQLTQRRTGMGEVAKLFDGVTPENYGQRIATAQQLGVDVSNVPQQYDPQWIEQQKTVMQFLGTRQGQEALSTAGKIAADEGLPPGTPQYAARVREITEAEFFKTVPYEPGGGVARVDARTGQVTPLIVPYGQPQQPAATSIPDAAIAALRSGEGTAEEFDAVFGAGAAAKAMGNQMSAPQAAGGQTRQPSGGFR